MDDPSLVLKVRSDLYPHMSNSVKFRYAEQTRCLTTSPKSVTSDECMNLPKQIPSPLVEVHESSSQDPRYIKSPSPSKFTNSVLVQENCPLSSEVEVQNVMTDIELSNKGLDRRELDSRTIESEHEDNGDSALNESDIDIEVDVETTVPQSPQGSDKCVTPVGMASKTCSYQSKGSPNLWEGSPIVKDSNEYDLVQVENGRIISAQSASKSPETSGLFKCSSPPCEDSSRTPFSSNPLNELLPTPPDESVYSGIHPLLINSPFAGGRSFINGNFGKVSETDLSDLISSSRPLFPDHAPFQSPLNAPAFNPFGVLPSLTRLQELHSTYLKRDEDGPEKTSVNGPFQDMSIPTHLIPWLISSQIQSYVQHQMALNSGEGRSFGADPLKGVYLPEDRDQQPLDLSAKSIPTGPPMYHETTSLNCPIDIKIASRGRRRTDSNKRNYTERELQAALQDIQSGKLGTRRAAVIYGIPRSTLRNKVYKLQAMKNNELNNAEKSIGPVPELIHQKDVPLLHGNELEVDKLGSESAEAKLLLKRRMFEKIEELSRNSEKHLNFNDKNRVLDSALSYLCENIPKLALNVDNQNSPKDIFSSLSLYPQMQDIVNKIIEDRFNEEIRKFNSTNDDNRRVDDNESVFNKTYVSSNDNNSTNIANYDYDITSSQSNVKDVISQMIQQKMLNSSSHPNYSTQCITTPQFSMSKISMNAVNYDRQNQAKGDHNEDPNKKREKSPTNNGGKGSRPKRGKYRNYDRDNLIKAVQSVQRGEMSVHRAGSYYGVPHSTLEYKVKERHLNKSRNKKDNFMTKVADTSPISSSLRHPNISNDFISHSLAYRNKENENDSNDEVSIIGCSATRSGYKSENDSNDVGKVSGPPNVYLSNTFPFMNNSSFLHPLLNPSFSVDSSLNSSGIIRNIQKSTLSSKATDQRPNNSSPEDTKDNEGSHYSYNFPDKDFVPEGTSFTPPSSPKSVQETLFNRLLINKFQSNVGDNIKDLEPDSQKETPNFSLSSADPAEIMRLKALLPSYLAARSVAAAIANNNINHNDENLPNEKKESLHIPVVSGTNSSDL